MVERHRDPHGSHSWGLHPQDLSKHFPKPPLPKTITLGIKISNWEVGGTKIQTRASPPNLIKVQSTLSRSKKNIVFVLYSSANELDNPLGFPGGSDSKESACNAGDPGSVPGSGRSPGEGNGTPLQCSYLENSMDKGAWGPQSMGSQRVRHDLATNTFTFNMYLFSFKAHFGFPVLRAPFSGSLVAPDPSLPTL